jgi:serine/threonine protein kinase
MLFFCFFLTDHARWQDGQPWEFPRDQLEMGELLGFGAFGDVFKATAYDMEGPGMVSVVAAKTLRPNAGEEDFVDFLTEIRLMQVLVEGVYRQQLQVDHHAQGWNLQEIGQHPNVVALKGICTLDPSKLMLLVEFMLDGCLKVCCLWLDFSLV